ncbi:putative membrane protein [Roseovarius sp. MBR-154]
METRLRSIVKAVIWNLIGLSVMAGVGLAVTGSLTAGGVMAVINTVIGFTTYLLYERVWSRIHWGRCHG